MHTIRQLLHYQSEINQMQGSIFAEFFRSKIKDFVQNNNIRVQTAYSKIEKLRDEYLELDEKRNVKLIGEGKEQKAVFKEGKTEEEFKEKYEELMNSEVQIKF